MGPDSEEHQTKNSKTLFGSGDLLLSLRIRHPFRNYNEMDGIILAYCCDFLLPFGSVLWSLLAFVSREKAGTKSATLV